jgi:CBS domain-containing protein
MTSVRDVMSSALVRVELESSVEDAAERMSTSRVGSALVFDGAKLAGILTERDVLRVVGAHKLAGATVAGCMTPNPETIGADETLEQAGVLMIHGGFRHLPVVDGADVIGVVSIRDLIKHTLSDQAPRGA